MPDNPPLVFDREAMAFLAGCADEHRWRGRPVEAWVRAVTGHEPSAPLKGLGPDRPDRTRLAAFCSPPPGDELDLFLAIGAWGGMKVGHAKAALAHEATLRQAVTTLRDRATDRREAYSIFATARANGRMPGVGPAYFTKLIFFIRPDLGGYIMDQWTARSVNVLTGRAMVRLGREHNVLDSNTADDYERFCRSIEAIASELGICPAAAEMRLFSHGGRQPGEWREYVKRRQGGDSDRN